MFLIAIEIGVFIALIYIIATVVLPKLFPKVFEKTARQEIMEDLSKAEESVITAEEVRARVAALDKRVKNLNKN